MGRLVPSIPLRSMLGCHARPPGFGFPQIPSRRLWSSANLVWNTTRDTCLGDVPGALKFMGRLVPSIPLRSILGCHARPPGSGLHVISDVGATMKYDPGGGS